MSRADDDEQAQQAYCRAAVRRSLPGISESAIFLAILSQNYEKDALAVLQFGLAILLDKPIYLLVKRGTRLAENVRRLARGIEEFSGQDDVEFASKRLLARARDDLR